MNFSFDIFKNDPDKSFVLDYAPLFAKLSFFEKNLIIQKSKVVEYNKGDIIYKQHDPPDALYCVITGRVRVIGGRDNSEVLEYLNCGKYFGMISLLIGEPHSVTVVAANDSKLLKIGKEDFQLILNKIPRLAIDLSKVLSRRLRRRDISEKRIFENNIISVFSAVAGIGRTMYAANLALSLKKETVKNVILIGVSRSADEVLGALGIAVGDAQGHTIKLDTACIKDSVINSAILKEQLSGISVLNICHDSANNASTANLNALLTQLTSDYHYIIVDLPAVMDDAVFGALKQSDLIHIITGYNIGSLTKTKNLLSELFENVNYPQDKIKVITNAHETAKYLVYEKVSNILGYKVYANLPLFDAARGEGGLSDGRLVLEQPKSEYAKAIRRIARELGDVRVGLALGGGAAFGLAQIGIIKILEREDVPIDAVTGSSIGALVGALWAVGLNSGEIEKVVLDYNNDKKKAFRLLFDFGFPKLSFVKGKRIRSFLLKHLDKKTFQDIKFPFKIAACNISRREEFIFDSGSLIDAVMASIAIPGVFAPLKRNGDLIIDGGIIDPVPIGPLVKMGIKKIIAVNVLPSSENILQSYEFNRKRLLEEERRAEQRGFFAKIAQKLSARFQKMLFPNILDIIVNSIQTMEYVIAEADCQKADVVLRPVPIGVEWFEFYKIDTLIKKGEEEASKLLPEIKSLVNE